VFTNTPPPLKKTFDTAKTDALFPRWDSTNQLHLKRIPSSTLLVTFLPFFLQKK